MGEITMDDVRIREGSGSGVDMKRLKEEIPDFEKFDKGAQEAVLHSLASGARVMVTTVATIHPERDRAQAGRVVNGRNGFVKGEHAVAMVVDWGSSTNGAYVFMNDPHGKYGLSFDGEGFSVVNKGSEPLANKRFFYSDHGVVDRKPGEESRRTALIQNVVSNNPDGADVDLSNYAKTHDDPTGSSLSLSVAPGTNLKFGPDTYGVSVYVHADKNRDISNHTRIIGDPANFKGATADISEFKTGMLTLKLGNRTQAEPVGNTTISFVGMDKGDFGTPQYDPAPADVMVTARGAKTPAIVPVILGFDDKNTGNRLNGTPAEVQTKVQKAAADAEAAGKAAGASLGR